MNEDGAPTLSPRATTALSAYIRKILTWLNEAPYALLAVPLRFSAATVFWRSGEAKLSNWETTLYLFQEEYRVPLLPPEFAAQLATAVELTAPCLLLIGLASRLTALILIAMTAIIQIFVYPMSWPTHIQWVAILLIILFRGPGAFSIDHALLSRRK